MIRRLSLPFVDSPQVQRGFDLITGFSRDVAKQINDILTAVYWDDQQVNLNNVKLPASGSPTWAAFKGGYALAFGGSADEAISFWAQLSHGYQEGSDLEFHLHYVPEDATPGNVRWKLTYSFASILDVFPTESEVVALIPTPGRADQHTLGEITDAIPGSGKRISSLLCCSLTREASEASDTYNSKDIYLCALDFHIKKDSRGSTREAIK